MLLVINLLILFLFSLRKTQAYVERCLAQAGLVVETAISYSPRQERGEPVPGFLYVVRRKRDGSI